MSVVKPITVEPRGGYKIWLRYSDGAEGEVDLSHLTGKGMFRAWEDRAFFESVQLGDFGVVTWGEDIDMCPDALYIEITGKSVDEALDIIYGPVCAACDGEAPGGEIEISTVRPITAEPLGGYKIRLRYSDGVEGEVDLSDHVGKGVFRAWDDRAFFESVRVGECGSVSWGNEIDICPDALYMEITGKSVEEALEIIYGPTQPICDCETIDGAVARSSIPDNA